MKFQTILMNPVVGFSLFLGLLISGFSLTAQLAEPAYGDEEGKKKCPSDCTAGWVLSDELLGGIECEHGPDDGAACSALGAQLKPFICCESVDEVIEETQVNQTPPIFMEKKDGKIDLYQKNPDGSRNSYPSFPFTIKKCDEAGACKCFVCSGTGCEGQFQVWLAHCGASDKEVEGECEFGESEEDQVLKKVRNTGAPTGGTCNGGEGHHHKRKWFCGAEELSPIDYADCLADNCPTNGNDPFLPDGDGSKGTKNHCPE